MNIRNIKWLALGLTLGLAACSGEEYSEQERTAAGFLDKLKGDISSAQLWKTTVDVVVNIQTDKPTKLYLYTVVNKKNLLIDYREVETSGLVHMTAPQGCKTPIRFAYVYDNKVKDEQTLPDFEKLSHNIDVNLISGSRASAFNPDLEPSVIMSVDESLKGSSMTSKWNPPVYATYHTFSDSPDDMQDCAALMEIFTAETEKIDAKKRGFNVNYELKSNGKFSITWMAGYGGNVDEYILGYYYHTPGTYRDCKFVDLSDTHKYDYIDGLAKVQYGINSEGEAIALTEIPGLLDNPSLVDEEGVKWWDANFDMYDYYGSSSGLNPKRKGDYAYNAMWVFRKFGRNINHLRGISFDINVPKGMHLGFYIRRTGVKSPAQYDRLASLGIANIPGTRSTFSGTCFSAQLLNSDGTHRSCVIPMKHVIWMGMEDTTTGGDRDCNDVIFGIDTHEGERPTPIDPDIDVIVEIDGLYPWTIAYEDIGRGADFDFNDAVIKILPDPRTQKCCVTVEAVGSDARMILHYDGPDGDIVLGEMHELLGGKVGTKINTATSVAQTPFVQVDCVPWLNGYTISNDAKRFWIEVQRGTCTDCSDAITLAEEPGQIPEALLISDEWKWPIESIHIFSAYNNFPNWAKDESMTKYWTWHNIPKSGTYVSY